MLIKESPGAAERPDRLKELKVRIPVRYHIRLLSMRVLMGRQISDTVTEALEAYFRHLSLEAPEASRLQVDGFSTRGAEPPALRGP